MSDHNDITNFLSTLKDTQLFAVLEAARIALADAEIADTIVESMNISDADANHLQNKIHEFMLKHKKITTTLYWCDDCGDPIVVGNEFHYAELPCDITSANRGESATVCRKCNERIEADYHNNHFKGNHK
jgi:hypothetical protein